MIGKVRPQIFMALFMLSLITGYAIFADMVDAKRKLFMIAVI